MFARVFWPLMFGLTGTAVLVALGVWQLQRLEWKEAILTDIDAKITADPVAIPAEPGAGAHRYLPVTAQGEIGAREIHVLVSQKRIGAGYRIIAPLTISDGRVVLLDRGFTKVENKAADRARGAVSVIGNLHWPNETGTSIPEPDINANIWFARDVPQMAAALGTLPIMVIARDTTPADPSVTPLPVDTSGIPNDHLQYAGTWFSLAAVWLVMSNFFAWRVSLSARAPEGRT